MFPLKAVSRFARNNCPHFRIRVEKGPEQLKSALVELFSL
jgi:hypothetical protein